MALEPCPECRAQYQFAGPSCPHCGIVRRSQSPQTAAARASRESAFGKGFGLAFGAVTALVVIAGLVAVVFFGALKGSGGDDRRADAVAKADLRNAMTAQEAYYSSNGSYPMHAMELTEAGYLNLSPGVTMKILRGGAHTYTMTTSAQYTGNTWCVNSNVGEIVEGESC